MKKYAVFTESSFNPEYELSISNKILEREGIFTIGSIINNWLNIIGYNVQFNINADKYNGELNNENVYLSSINGTIVHGLHINIIYKESNIRVQLGRYENVYNIKKVD